MSPKIYFVTGASRGIGFQFIRHISKEDGSNVIIATVRDPSKATELQDLRSQNPNIHIIKLDVASQESIDEIDQQIGSICQDGIDVFISNAAIADVRTSLLNTDRQTWYDHFTVNAVGPIQITKVLYKYLMKKNTRKIFFISSIAGSMTTPHSIATGAYGQSKAALNHFALSLSRELRDEEFTVVAVQPGAVDTEMSNGRLDTLQGVTPEFVENIRKTLISTEECVSQIFSNIVNKVTVEDTGKFYSYDGTNPGF